MTKLERLREKLKTASPEEAKTIKNAINALSGPETDPIAPPPGGCAICGNPNRFHFMNAEQAKAWGGTARGRAKFVVREGIE
jgi:hypothetical protein